MTPPPIEEPVTVHPDAADPVGDFRGWLNRLVREARAATDSTKDDALLAELFDKADELTDEVGGDRFRAEYRCHEGYTYTIEAADGGVDADHARTCPFCGADAELVGDQ